MDWKGRRAAPTPDASGQRGVPTSVTDASPQTRRFAHGFGNSQRSQGILLRASVVVRAGDSVGGYLFSVAQTSKSAVSRVSKPAAINGGADLEVGDTAGLETCATRGRQLALNRTAGGTPAVAVGTTALHGKSGGAAGRERAGLAPEAQRYMEGANRGDWRLLIWSASRRPGQASRLCYPTTGLGAGEKCWGGFGGGFRRRDASGW